MKMLFGFLLLFFSACAHPPKTICTDLSHLENGRFIYLEEDKEFARQQNFCVNTYNAPLDREKFHKHFTVGRTKMLQQLCTCQNGYSDRLKAKADEPTSNKSMPLIGWCRDVKLDHLYAKGVSLAARDLKNFKPNHWSGPNSLTSVDGEKACK